MIAPGSPTVRRRRLAAELRGIREDKGKSGDAVAAALKWSPSKISRYERARTGLRPREVERLLDYYQITGSHRELLLGLAEDAAQKGWWEEFADSLSEDYQQFIGLEHEAASMSIWHVDVVTGLLQTEDYARHIISSYSRVEPIAPGMIGRLVRVQDAPAAGAEPRRAAAVGGAGRIGPEAPDRRQRGHVRPASAARPGGRTAQPDAADPPPQRAARGVRGILRRLRLRLRHRGDAAGRRGHRAAEEQLHPGGGTGDVPAPDRVPDARQRLARPGGIPRADPRHRRIVLVGRPAPRSRVSRPQIKAQIEAQIKAQLRR